MFERLNRALRLTDAGEILARDLGPVFDRIEDILWQLPLVRDAPDRQKVLHLDVLPSFAAKFLSARLPDFHASHPHIGVNIQATDHLSADGINRVFDLAVRYGPGPYSGVRADPLITGGRIVAVCAPRLINETKKVLEGQISANAQLIHTSRPESADNDACASWQTWFRMHGVAISGSLSSYPSFSNAHLAIDAAIAGQGIALVPYIFVIDDIAAGLLTMAAEQSIPDPSTLWLLRPVERRSKPAVQGFVDWLSTRISIALGSHDR